jgi:heavy metal sensor kinase
VVLKTQPGPGIAIPRRGRGPGQPPPERNEPPRFFRPSVYIHCAYDKERYIKKEAEFAERRDNEKTALEEETLADKASIRYWLMLIASLTFLATLVGSFGLIRLGLSPLSRLSVAVSQVSPRDFRLPLDPRRLPSELKPITQRIQGTLDLLKRAFGREKQATADISHELRTPLAVMLTTTELGLRKQRSAEQYRELLQDCRASAQQMNEIVNRLLTLARLDAGVDQLQRRTIDVALLADQCADMVRPLAEAQGLTLHVHHVPAVPAQTDPDKLREVLNNLLHNAIQYNRPNGRIDVRVGQKESQLWMEVEDTGIGISPEARPQIFERFFRADPSRAGDGLHAGLGLALVKEYVDLMGGRIDVESQEGQGSTFRIWLPA